MSDPGHNNHNEANMPFGDPETPDTNTATRLRAAIANNPRRTTSVLVTSLLTICPGLLIGPLLPLLGFGGLGPAAGGLAAGFQSLFGTPWLFRVLQSAAMGGWGAALVGGIVRAFSAGGVVVEVVNRILGCDGGEEGDEFGLSGDDE